ncbi:uncharacterized protein LOC117335180 [Pecten maximus]|uniref:uncharacterized protein LOC117335180 n=1 Tax=Pecten maximus TaxID=6579 RepID=UPI00145889E9|nr:uncharacterized protein LOC117335180 [Pecten maximus]XP_033751053.1 uncharacterized protein LOC117335180 [Pecten maximus]
MLVAIAVGALLLLLLLSLLICCCCRWCCFEEAAVGAKTRGEERVFDKRKMDGVFMERDGRKDDVSRKQRTKSVVSMESLDGYRVNEVKPRAMRLVSVDSHHSLDAVPILIPSSAGRHSTRHTTPMAKVTGTQYERIHTTPMARNAGTQYEDVAERVIYPSPKSKTFGTQYECIEEEMPTKDIGTITDRRGSLTPSVSQFSSKMSSARTPRTLRAVAPMQINPEVLTPIVMTTKDASTSAMSSPERRFKSANVQTDLSVLKPPSPLPKSYSTQSKSIGHPSTILPNDVEAEIDIFPQRSLTSTAKSVDVNSVNIPPTAASDHRVPFSDIASCPTAVPLRPQDIPRTRDHSYLRYPSKAASHPITLWDIPLKSYPDSITYPSKDSSGDVTPPINRIEYNMIYDNRVNNTDNTYIHNFLEDAKKMARKPKVSRPPRLAAIPGNVESPVGMYDPFPEKSDAHDIIKPGLEKQTTFNNIPAVKGPEVRAILYEPHHRKDSTDC